MRSRHALGAALLFTMLLSSSAVLADVNVPATTGEVQRVPTAAAQVTMVASGAKRGRIDGDNRLRYPGFEQTAVAYSKGHIVLITMEAVREPNRAPVQCSCSSYELRPDGPPRLVTDLKRLTEYQSGDRACNHPAAATDEQGNIVWMYGSDSMNREENRPDTYAGILNEKCEQLAAPQMVSIRRNANDGAPAISHLGNGAFVAGYYSDGGGEVGGFPEPGGDYSVALGLQVKSGALLPTLERTWITPVVTPTAIGRPTIVTASPDRALYCAPKGPNRPSDHIECALVDTISGAVVWKNEIVQGNRQQKKYYNQPTLAKIGENKFALLALESNGMGKNTNIKGSNISHLFMLEKNGDSITVASEIVGAGAHQTHASICAGPYGEAGTPVVNLFSAAPTGIGRAAMTMVGYDDATKKFGFDPVADLWPAAWYGDSGHLANIYGRNPMRQGRDFLRCIGGVENPGYHQPNGFMADVKSFFVAPVHGRIPGDEKNSLFLSLVPGQMDKKVQPQNPVPAGEEPNLDPNATAGEESAADASGGCGCATPGTTPTSRGAAVASLLAVGLVLSRRRRNR